MSRGFSNWKDACVSFGKHELSATHKEAVEMILTLPATTKNVGSLLSRQYSQQVATNRKMLLKITSTIRFLTRQGLALRGHDHMEGNFIQLLKFLSIEDSELFEWIKKKSNKYTSPDIQNELIRLMHGYQHSEGPIETSSGVSVLIRNDR